jgi:uncharacterized protein YraI
MEKGFRFRWQLLLGASLAMACFSCRPAAPPVPRAQLPPPPVASPEQAPQRPTLYVKVARLNLRAGPGLDFPKLGTLERNEEVEKVGEAENWNQIRVKRDGTLGWVSSEHLSSTPVTSPIQTPVPETPVPPAAKEKQTPAPPGPAEVKPKPPAPAKTAPTAPEVTKPEEVEEPPPPPHRRKPAEESAPKAEQEKPAPNQEEPPPPPKPATPAPEEKPSGIRIM